MCQIKFRITNQLVVAVDADRGQYLSYRLSLVRLSLDQGAHKTANQMAILCYE